MSVLQLKRWRKEGQELSQDDLEPPPPPIMGSGFSRTTEDNAHRCQSVQKPALHLEAEVDGPTHSQPTCWLARILTVSCSLSCVYAPVQRQALYCIVTNAKRPGFCTGGVRAKPDMQMPGSLEKGKQHQAQQVSRCPDQTQLPDCR